MEKEIELKDRKVGIGHGENLSPAHRVQILWGKHPKDDADIIEYRFKTDAEVMAFMDGVEAAIGWHEYEDVTGFADEK
jgi:hypothetical protein